MARHRNLQDAEIHAATFVDTSDPHAVYSGESLSNKLWVDRSQSQLTLQIRKDDDSGWDPVGPFWSKGTWTPTFTFATLGDLAVTYSTQVGNWQRIGNVVQYNMLIVTTAFTFITASGVAQITGFPFTSSGTGNAYNGYAQGWTKTNYTQVGAFIANNASNFLLRVMGSGQIATDLTAADFATGTNVVVRAGGNIFI